MALNNNSIVSFKQGFNGGTRANRFVVQPQWPNSLNVPNSESTFKMVSASLPVAQVNPISIPYRGRLINFAGDRQYTPWSVGIYDDNNPNGLWKGLQKWTELMDGHYTHKVINNDFAYQQLQTTWVIRQLDLNGANTIRKITLYKCWPSMIEEIPLNMGEGSFVTFSAVLTFDYAKIEDIAVSI